MRCGPLEKGVEAAAVSIFSLASVPFELVGITQSRHPSRQRREDARPAEFVREKSGHREAKIAHDLRFHPKPVLARQQLVGGIDLAKLLAMGRRLLIGRGRHNRFDHLLTTPSQPPVIGGKPIEQLRVDWTLTPHPKIVHGAHQPLTEQFVPEVIRQDPGRQWVVLRNQPVRKIQPVQLSFLPPLNRWQDSKATRFHFHVGRL